MKSIPYDMPEDGGDGDEDSDVDVEAYMIKRTIRLEVLLIVFLRLLHIMLKIYFSCKNKTTHVSMTEPSPPHLHTPPHTHVYTSMSYDAPYTCMR